MPVKLLILLLVVTTCGVVASAQSPAPSGSQNIDVEGKFSFSLPTGFKKTTMAGMEHLLGEYYNGDTRFLFIYGDTGSNAYDVRREPEMQEYHETETKISGRRANIRTYYLTPNRHRLYKAELNIGDWENADVELYMELSGSTPAVLDMAQQVFSSVKLP